jgi:circadian clock protein KaiB
MIGMGNEEKEGKRVEKYRLKLYITGATSRSRRAIANLRQICEEELGGRYELIVIDVLEDPQAAEADKVVATPTLVKELPMPTRRIIGDLFDKNMVMLALDIL